MMRSRRTTRSGRRPARTIAFALVVAGIGWMTVGYLWGRPASSAGFEAADLRYGVSAAPGSPGVAVHWILCPGETARVVDLGVLVGGSRTPAGVPVVWQIRAIAPEPAARPQALVFVAGTVPAGWYETVPMIGPLPADLIEIAAPPGDGSADRGRSFDPRELRMGWVERGGYDRVPTDRFVSDGVASCGSTTSAVSAPLNGLGLVLLGLGGLALAGRRHPVLAGVAATGLVVGSMMVVEPLGAAIQDGVRDATRAVSSTSQAPEAFAPGTVPPPAWRDVLLELAADTARIRPDGMVLARFVAYGDYAFLVGCDGAGLQVGELAPIQNGVTGGRQLVGCANGAAVRSSIGGRADRGDVVELIVYPNGITDWHLLVVSGEGDVGPFTEP